MGRRAQRRWIDVHPARRRPMLQTQDLTDYTASLFDRPEQAEQAAEVIEAIWRLYDTEAPFVLADALGLLLCEQLRATEIKRSKWYRYSGLFVWLFHGLTLRASEARTFPRACLERLRRLVRPEVALSELVS